MVVFGDSLSDNGNLYNFLWHTIPASPPYYLGHFSNGTLWAEQLYSSYFPTEYDEGFKNYAVGGAGAVLAYKQDLPYTLTMELDNYLFWHTYGKKESSLFAIWIGGNNYLNGPTNVESITDSVVNAIAGVIERLIREGGTKFFIPNLPDLTQTPFVIESGKQTLIARLVQVHNVKLARKIDELKTKYPDVTFVYFDVYSFFNHAIDNASDYGFSYVNEPCYLGGYLGWLSKNQPSDATLQSYLEKVSSNYDSRSWDSIKNNPQLKEAAAASYIYQLLPEKNKEEALYCENYVFWDRIHPTTKAHSYIASEARRLLDEAGLVSFRSEPENKRP
jgi:phospholipase/lecithinase/hemolysin